MSQLFVLPFQVPFKSSAPLGLAKLYFYEAGTTNHQAVYTTQARNVAHDQPVRSDANGVFPPIYLNPTADHDYRIQLKTDADVLVTDGDVDNIPKGFSQADIGASLYPKTDAEDDAAVTPISFEIVNDYTGIIIPDRYVTNASPGTTDMTNAIQQALNVASESSSKAAKVQLLADTYLTGNIDWPANGLTLQGASSCFSADTSGTPRTTLKAKSATTIVLDLIQTGTVVDRQGNLISDLEIDGNSIANIGIETNLNNIIERVSVKGTTAAGIQLANYTNGAIIRNCKLNNNSGWGLKVTGDGSTVYEIIQTRASSNTLGGFNLEAGVGVRAQSCVIESNGGPALRIHRPTGHSGGFLDFIFDKCWFEDNASGTPYFTLAIGSDVSGFDNYPARIFFRQCRFNTGQSSRKHMTLGLCAWVEFEGCNFDASTQSDALTFATQSTYVSLINCDTASLFVGLSATQIDNAIAQGTRCWSHDTEIVRAVSAFTNSWVNFGAPYGDASYWHTRDGNVRLGGAIKSGTVTNAAFTLPVGYRPSTTMDFAVDSNGAYGMVRITSAGVVTPQVGSNSIFNLDGIEFSTK